jgi:hypothetical protein
VRRSCRERLRHRFGAGSWRTALSAPPLRPAGSRPSGHGSTIRPPISISFSLVGDRCATSSGTASVGSGVGGEPRDFEPVHLAARRCCTIEPLTADDRAWRDRGRGVRWNADDEGQAGKLWSPWHSTSPNSLHDRTRVHAASLGGLDRSIRWLCKIEHKTY